jgi:hypothetical protein
LFSAGCYFEGKQLNLKKDDIKALEICHVIHQSLKSYQNFIMFAAKIFIIALFCVAGVSYFSYQS